jgi:WhiB family redox-sensing transcriptional regulator
MEMMLPQLRREPWMVAALCAQVDGDLFFADKGDWNQTIQAKLVCRECPVRTECLLYALENNETHGVWGGMTPTQRKELLRQPKGCWRELAS